MRVTQIMNMKLLKYIMEHREVTTLYWESSFASNLMIDEFYIKKKHALSDRWYTLVRFGCQVDSSHTCTAVAYPVELYSFEGKHQGVQVDILIFEGFNVRKSNPTLVFPLR